jgi:putative DNA primase/helicase
VNQLIDVLIPKDAEGFVNLRSFNDRKKLPPRQTFVKASAPDREDEIKTAVATDLLGGYDTYVGTAERAYESGTKAACSILRALFVDIDVVKEGRAFKAELEKLDAFKPRPNIVINSGNGLHVYWGLSTPINLQAMGEIARAESLLRRLAVAVGGDLKATDVSRVLRIEGTLNYKGAGPKCVEVIWLDPKAVL